MDAPELYSRLTALCEEITRGEYDKAKTIFELAPCESGEDSGINVLAEALGLMLVRIEAREFELERAVAELTVIREELMRHKERLANENSRLRAELRRSTKAVRPVAAAPVMLELLRQAERVALAGATLMLTGETGTGKGLFARYIHALGPRADKPFVAVNCAAIPASLLESELFGIESGVATGVQARAGRFEQASGGTILLDEICDMPLESQAKLLHVLETGQVERVGGRKPIGVGVRIMAATNRDLEKRVEEGLFRADLYHRLHVMSLHVPPLRERREDIPLLCRVILARVAERSPLAATALSPEALHMILGYSWPGNVRELENELERAALMADGLQIAPADLLPQLQALHGAHELPSPALPSQLQPTIGIDGDNIPSLAEVEAAHIAAVLQHLGGNKSRAARVLGISREGLRVKLGKS